MEMLLLAVLCLGTCQGVSLTKEPEGFSSAKGPAPSTIPTGAQSPSVASRCSSASDSSADEDQLSDLIGDADPPETMLPRRRRAAVTCDSESHAQSSEMVCQEWAQVPIAPAVDSRESSSQPVPAVFHIELSELSFPQSRVLRRTGHAS